MRADGRTAHVAERTEIMSGAADERERARAGVECTCAGPHK